MTMMTTILITLLLYAGFVLLVFIVRFVVMCIEGLRSENARIRTKEAAKEAKRNGDAVLSGKTGGRNKPARWTQRTHLFRADEYICSACGASCGKPYKVCPSCRTLMKKSKYDPSWVDEAEAMSAMLDDDW